MSDQPSAKKPIYKRWWVWVLAVVVVIAVASSIGDDDTDSGTPAAASTPAASATVKSPAASPSSPAPKLSPFAELKNSVKDALGDGNRESVDRLKKVNLNKGQVTVNWAINDNLTEGLIKSGARSDVKDILQAVKDTDGLKYTFVFVQGSFAMQDKYGRTSEDVVMRLGYTRATVKKMQLDNLSSDQVVALADGPSYVQSAFQD